MKKRICRLTALVLPLALSFASPGFGQELVPGERIRVYSSGVETGAVVGMLEAMDSRYLIVRTDESARASVLWDDVSRIELSHEKKSRALLGTAIGAGVGILASGIWWSAVNEEDDASFFNGYAVAAGAAAGALLGFAVGSAIKVERWEDVPANRWKLQLTPDPDGGVVFGAALRL